MKFIYITDTHFRRTTPPSRTDDYLIASMTKIKDVLDYATREGIKNIVHGGDFFDDMQPYDVTTEVGALIFAYNHVNWFVNIGQHDMRDHTHINDRPIRTLDRLLPNFNVMPNGEFTEVDDGYVYANWYDNTRARDPEFYSLFLPDHVNAPVVHTAHGLLVEREFYGSYVLLSDVPPSHADLFLGSDYHPGWKTQNLHGCTYANPGSLMRKECPSPMRFPKFLDVEIGGMDGKVGIIEITLNKETPFVVKKVKAEEAETPAMDIGIAKFIETEFQSGGVSHPKNLIQEVGKTTNVDNRVIEKAVELITEVEDD